MAKLHTAGHISRYLDKTGKKEPLMSAPVNPRVRTIIVIPAFHERGLFDTLDSLDQCAGDKAESEVIVVLNSGQDADKGIVELHRNQQLKIKNRQGGIAVHPILLEDIPVKIVGVGYARKTGMDEALLRLAPYHAHDGIIICLDADCEVSSNYLSEIRGYFDREDAKEAVHLYFEHPLPPAGPERSAIVTYELHLRLMKNFLSRTGHPQACYAVGSCMAVQAWAYAAQGGMNVRQAGEDFYFIHKYSKIGQLHELNTATVYPSPRTSDRVPFGTGAAIKKQMQGREQRTYHPTSYERIREFIDSIPNYYLHREIDLQPIFHYQEEMIRKKLIEAVEHSSEKQTFVKRFMAWFDAFRIVKALHYLRDEGLADVPVYDAAQVWSQKTGLPQSKDKEEYLMQMRRLEQA